MSCHNGNGVEETAKRQRDEAYGSGPESCVSQRGQSTAFPGLPIFIRDVKPQPQPVAETLLALTFFDSRSIVFWNYGPERAVCVFTCLVFPQSLTQQESSVIHFHATFVFLLILTRNIFICISLKSGGNMRKMHFITQQAPLKDEVGPMTSGYLSFVVCFSS